MLLGSNIYGLERGYNRKWTRSPIFTKSDTFSVNNTKIVNSTIMNIVNHKIHFL